MDNIIITNETTNHIKEKRIYMKQYVFINERKEILNKIMNIIKINNSNLTFYSHELDKNIEGQQEILNMIPDIEKYFKVSSWASFQSNKNVSRKYLSIVKSILKDMDIKFNTCQVKMKVNKSTPN